MAIADSFLDARRRTMQEFERNADKKDPEYIALLEELKRIMGNHNVEEMTAEEMKEQQEALEELRRKIHEKNAEDSRLSARYGGDDKFMRIHKRLSGEFSSPSSLHQLLFSIKTQADGKILTNYAILDNPSYFERGLWRDLKQEMESLSLPVSAETVKRVSAAIAQEYILERNT